MAWEGGAGIHLVGDGGPGEVRGAAAEGEAGVEGGEE